MSVIVSSPGNRAYCYAELAVSSLAMAVIIASTHFAYPRRDGQAELAWVTADHLHYAHGLSSYPNQLSLAILPPAGAMSTSRSSGVSRRTVQCTSPAAYVAME